MTGFETQAGRPHRPVAGGLDAVPVALGDGLEVRAGAEHPVGTREDGDVGVVVGVERTERRRQERRRRTVDGVAAVRSVDRHDARAIDGATSTSRHGHLLVGPEPTGRPPRLRVGSRAEPLEERREEARPALVARDSSATVARVRAQRVGEAKRRGDDLFERATSCGS